MICNWCNQREVKYELVVYRLKEEDYHPMNSMERRTQLVRGDKYVSVRICKSCLPVTTITEHVKEIAEESAKRKEKRTIT